MRLFFCFLLVLIISSCNLKESHDSESIKQININTDDPRNLRLSDIFASVEIITLDKKEIVGGVDDLIWTKNAMIVLDKKKTKTIFIFDHKGQIISSIKASGEGPGQFLYPKNIQYSELRNSIFIWCSGTAKFLEFNLNGDFIQEIKFDGVVAVGDFFIQKDKFIFYNLITNSGNEEVIFLDEKFQILQNIDLGKIISNDLKVSSLKENFFYPTYDNKGFYFKQVYGNRLVEFRDNYVNSLIMFNYGQHTLHYDSKKIYSAGQIHENLLQTNSMTTGDDLIDLENILFFEFIEGNVTKLGVYDKIIKKSLFIEVLENDMDKLFDFSSILSTFSNSDGFFYLVYSPDILLSRIRRTSNNKYVNIKTIIDADPENPVIFKYKFKENIKLSF
ncbi:6-bladed beta-propeller [Algoriphagus hitonicola]|uniref:6-bladed beta-propeller protein n=1 Tax=Algoriphagus hitonicola TaxID=435880 RepID=A0A1I2XXC2_9BACT|nr:6-bladed beta-propeller [Algoriphagus hitonicola]SFH18114.1 hypothetical protein SAMN04487988_1291 [Algoriphagus hitonicola]